MFSIDWSSGCSSNPLYHSFFWRSSFGFGQLQNASPTRPWAIILIFVLFFIRSIPCGKQSTKMNSSHRLHLKWKKLRELLVLLKDIAVEKMIIVTIEQKSCKRIFICGSACICSSVFRLCCIYHSSFPGVLQVIALLYYVGASRFGISWIACANSSSEGNNSLVDEFIN